MDMRLTNLQTTVSGRHDWLDWTALIVSVLGVLVSIVGLIATYRQASAAKDASIAAREAATNAVVKVRQKEHLMVLSSIAPQLQLTHEYLNSNNIAAARQSFTACTRDIKSVLHTASAHSKLTDEHAKVDRAMKEIASALDKDAINSSKKDRIVSLIRVVSEEMVSEQTIGKWVEQ